jgi:ceramide glucosyltransferase
LFIFSAITKLLLALGLVGLLSSSVYCGLVLVAAMGFSRRHPVTATAGNFSPALSLLKPLHGGEPDLEARLEGFFRQDYPHYEILFCARYLDDAGLEVARRVARRYPEIPVQFLATGEPVYTNAKVGSLERMGMAARHDLLTISDSDVRVEPNYLREVVAPFADPAVGLVTCLYRGIADGQSLWSKLEAAAMSIEMSSGVLVAERLEGMKFALGPTMAVRRQCVDEIGGFGTLGRYCADDFVLGNEVAAHGHRVILSGHVIDHVILNSGFVESIKHQVRWMKSTRFSRPKGHLGTALTFSVPFGLLVLVEAIALHSPLLGIAGFAWSVLTRMLLAAVVGGLVVREQRLWRTVLLYPLRDLMGFGYWAASYGSNRILWRGETFELLRDGVMGRSREQGSRDRD